ncbi:hypothetical protein FQN53_006616 [Emmonsiellopsis sp. PD_33]|nr:hypothetical protein FQN53_006616 [Emmonsiellopsis sp. PD_33]
MPKEATDNTIAMDELELESEMEKALLLQRALSIAEDTKEESRTVEAILDSPTTPSRHATERSRSRSQSVTGVREEDERSLSSSPSRDHQLPPTRPLVPPHRTSTGLGNNNMSRPQTDKDLPPRVPPRGDPPEYIQQEARQLQQTQRTFLQFGNGPPFAERARRQVRTVTMSEVRQEIAFHQNAAYNAIREAEHYKSLASQLKRELAECKEDLFRAEDEKKALGQQILELGTVAEGVTDEVLRRLYQSTTGCAVESHSKLFGKPTGNDHERLGTLLGPDYLLLLAKFGRKYYHSLLASALYKETADVVASKYVVGATSGIMKLKEQIGVEGNPGDFLSFLHILEEVFQVDALAVPRRDINIWRSSFIKLLNHLPEVKEISASFLGSKPSPDSELTHLVDEAWARLELHIPLSDKGRRSLLKLLKLQANLRLKTCMSLASYESVYYRPGTPYNRATMSIVDVTEGECEDDELHRLGSDSHGSGLFVGFCFFPALVKWGNDRGFDMLNGFVVSRATVLPVFGDDPFLADMKDAAQSQYGNDVPMSDP